MANLENKTIIILSPQSWGKMFLSKHHYAIELARRGNRVYFLNPPEQGREVKGARISIKPSGISENLLLISHSLYFPYDLRFHLPRLFHFLMRFHLKRILSAIGSKPDLVWSFDIGNLYPLQLFGDRTVKIFHPVDEPLNQQAIDAARGADIIFSVTREILAKYDAFPVPKHFINHGVTPDFIHEPVASVNDPDTLRVGISGNLTRSDIDHEVMIRIIQDNPEVIFECWGAVHSKDSNIGSSEDPMVISFAKTLQEAANVILHGVVNSSVLAKEYKRMDAFLICYDVGKDQSKGTNYHKVMEFLGSGKVIVSNNITTYDDADPLLVMSTDRKANSDLPGLFKRVVSRISFYNDVSKQERRIRFAKSNTYDRQVDLIQTKLTEVFHES